MSEGVSESDLPACTVAQATAAVECQECGCLHRESDGHWNGQDGGERITDKTVHALIRKGYFRVTHRVRRNGVPIDVRVEPTYLPKPEAQP